MLTCDCLPAAHLAAMASQMSPASFSNLDLGEGAVLHDNPLGGTWHDNPLVGSAMSTPRDSPRPPRLLLPDEGTTEVVSAPLVRTLQSGFICVVPMLYSSSQLSSPPLPRPFRMHLVGIEVLLPKQPCTVSCNHQQACGAVCSSTS